MEFVASSISNIVQMTSLVDPALLTGALSALTNIMVLNNWHNETKSILHKLYSLLDEGHWNRDGFSLQSLRLLINLSCNEDMVPSLLAAEVTFILFEDVSLLFLYWPLHRMALEEIMYMVIEILLFRILWSFRIYGILSFSFWISYYIKVHSEEAI